MKGRSRRLSLSQTAYLLTTLSIQHIEIYSAEYISAKIKISALKKLCVVYVVVQFYPWFKFYFPLFQTHYHTLQYPKQKQKKLN